MTRDDFDERLGDYHKFVADCNEAAHEMVNAMGGTVNLDMDGEYEFIGLDGLGIPKRAYIEDGNLFFEVDFDWGTYTMDFIQVTWDAILLADVMDCLFDKFEKRD